MAQFQGWARVTLVLGSISPLVVFQGVSTSRSTPRIGFAIAIFGLILFLLPLLVPLLAKTVASMPLPLVRTGLATPNLFSLLAGFLLPFVGLDITDPLEVGAVLFILLVFAAVSTRSSLVYLQPIFFIVGWHVYECEKSSGETCWIISKETLVPGTVMARDLGKHVWIN